jgi:branched-subunit amino acid ABC-type transport system permease component/ABC-type branched-subunit amino acid transport system ATPase component
VSKFLTLLISGAASGAIFGIMASGIVLTYETTGIFNFAHGAVAFATAFVYWQLHSGAHWPIVPAAIFSILIFAPLMGLILDKIMLRRLATAPVYARIVGTIGLLVALPNLALWVLEEINARGYHLPTTTEVITVPGLGPTPPYTWHLMKGLVLDSDQLATFAAALIAAVGLWVVIRRTRVGLLMRADVDRRELATLRGVNTGQVSSLTWVLTMMLAGLGGCLLGPLYGMADFTYTLVVLGALAAIVFAGLRSLPLAFFGGVLLGVIQNMVAGYGNSFIPGFLLHLSGFRTAIPFILTIVGLVVLGSRKARSARTVSREAPAPDHRRGLPLWRRQLPWGIAIAALVVYTFFFSGTYWSSQIALGLVLAIIFLSFVVVTGIGGMVSLAQAAFVTAGAFATGWALKHHFGSDVPLFVAHGHINFLFATLFGAAVCMAAGVLIAIPVRRLGALELALATLSMAFIADEIIFFLNSVRNGSDGYTVNPPIVGPFHFSDPKTLALGLLVIFGLLTVVVVNLQRSASGRAMFAARSSDVAARTSGLSPDRAKIAIFAVSAAIAGIGGAFYAVIASPFSNTTTPTITGLIWLAVVVTWGVRRPAGALMAGLTFGVGAAVLTKVTGTSGFFHDLVSSSHFLPILFGLGAINLAKNPDGILALTAQQRSEKKQAKLLKLERAADRRAQALAASGAGEGTGVAGGPAGPEVRAAGDERDAAAAGDGRQAPSVTDGASARDAVAAGTVVAGASPGAAPAPVPASAASASAGRGDEPLLSIEHVTAGYGEVEVLHGVDLAIARGSIMALLGSNGAGKSTLCGVAAGLIQPTRGRIVLDGVDVTSWPAYRRASAGIMLTPEARGVFPGLTVEENLSVWLRTQAERDAACAHFPVIGQRRQQRAGLLSGGEQQILALAPALVHPPRVFIADEPTLGLAPLAAARVCEILGELRALGTSVLLVEEKTANVLELADTVALMQLGHIVWVGPRAQLDLEHLTSAYLGGHTEQALSR